MALEVLGRFPVGRVNEHTVANIGTIRGGEAVNVVPETVKATGEIRSFESSHIDGMKNKLMDDAARVAKKYGGSIKPEFNVGFKGFLLTDSFNAVKQIETTVRSMNLDPKPLTYYGGSDANVMNSQGITTVNLGIGVRNAHSRDEHIAVSDLALAAELLLRLIGTENE